MILTGAGDGFTGSRAYEGVEKDFHTMRPEAWEHLHADGMELTDSLLARADMIFTASPSNDPTAIDSVTGRTYQRYASKLAPAASRASASTTTTRSHIGSMAPKTRVRGKSSMRLAIQPEQARVA